MLSHSDYQSLKVSVKGWDARKLRSYGVIWPPVHGWRKRLIAEYENRNLPPSKERPTVYHSDTPEQLNELFQKEKRLTAYWYERMSGAVDWKPGEKDAVSRQQDQIAMAIDQAIQRRDKVAPYWCTTQGTKAS